MKRIAVITLLLVLLATPAFAVLKMLPAEVAKELDGIAKEHAAARLKVSVDKVEIIDPWLIELFNLKTEVYAVPLIVNGTKTIEYVKVDTKSVISEEDMEALRAEDAKKAPTEPVFKITAIGMENENAEVSVTEATKVNYTPYIAGVIGLLVLGTGATALKKRLN